MFVDRLASPVTWAKLVYLEWTVKRDPTVLKVHLAKLDRLDPSAIKAPQVLQVSLALMDQVATTVPPDPTERTAYLVQTENPDRKDLLGRLVHQATLAGKEFVVVQEPKVNVDPKDLMESKELLDRLAQWVPLVRLAILELPERLVMPVMSDMPDLLVLTVVRDIVVSLVFAGLLVNLASSQSLWRDPVVPGLKDLEELLARLELMARQVQEVNLGRKDLLENRATLVHVGHLELQVQLEPMGKPVEMVRMDVTEVPAKTDHQVQQDPPVMQVPWEHKAHLVHPVSREHLVNPA